MLRRETGESSQPRATEQGERTQTAFPHETPSRRDVLRDQDAFRAVASPETFDPASPGAIALEMRGEKRSAQQALLTAPWTAPESALKAPRLREEERPGSISLRSLRMRAHYLLDMGPFSEEAKEKHQVALNRPEVKEKHQAAIKAAMKRPEVKEKHQAATKAAMNRPEVKEKRQEAYLDKLAKVRTDVFAPEELATANSTASQAIGGGNSYAWMKASQPASQQ